MNKDIARIYGVGVSDGVGVGKAYVIEKKDFKISNMPAGDKRGELARFESALKSVAGETRILLEKAGSKSADPKGEMLDAYLTLLEDPGTTDGIRDLIAKSYNAPHAVREGMGGLINVFEALDDAYMRERAFDIRDMMHALLGKLLNIERRDLSQIPPGSVIIAEELAASDAARMNLENVAGIITVHGGRNSHTSIIARSCEIPAIVGAANILNIVDEGDEVLIDGTGGVAYIRPDSDERQSFMERGKACLRDKESFKAFAGKKAATLDGTEVEVLANISAAAEVKKAVENGADGVGLFRSEYLYMDANAFPSEEYQFEAYRQAAVAMGGRAVAIRTMDIGGDKQPGYMGMEKEDNPYLGYRAIRMSLDRMGLFTTQLRAVLRASHYGKVRVLIPFVSSVSEMRRARAAFERAKEELMCEGTLFDSETKLGAMIEVPSAAILAREFAAECDFFTIGTNDLIQYTLAVDRGNHKVSDLYTSYHPAVLKLVGHVIKSASEAGIPCCVCGEAAGDAGLIPVFLGMGLRSLSVGAGSMLKVRAAISSVCLKDAEELARKVGECVTRDEVQSVISGFNAKPPQV